MKKQNAMLAGMVVLLSTVTGAALAVEPAKAVTAIQGSQAAPVSSKEVSALELQVSLLEAAVLPQTAKEASEKWSKALSIRNGAFQYALFTKELKEKAAPYFKEEKWVTGGSSPWIVSYQFTKEQKLRDDLYEYTITFDLATSTGHYGKESAVIMVKQVGENWYIDHVMIGADAVISARTPYPSIPPKMVDTFTYRAAPYAFSLPKSWDLKYHAVEKDGKLIVNYKPKNNAVAERFLLSIEKIKTEAWKKGGYEDSLYKKVGEKGGYVYAMLWASENQYADRPDSVEYKEFHEMSRLSNAIAETFQLIH
ncbi:hypothetical protein [Aneurinibacillus sp. REN35]|uniref:hypothetical protein n=1 Tax=Aneurinibacillus sp. REN35 TaxID=3237286 RepID=UPI0035282A5B